jgi:hypothetical protein
MALSLEKSHTHVYATCDVGVVCVCVYVHAALSTAGVWSFAGWEFVLFVVEPLAWKTGGGGGARALSAKLFHEYLFAARCVRCQCKLEVNSCLRLSLSSCTFSVIKIIHFFRAPRWKRQRVTSKCSRAAALVAQREQPFAFCLRLRAIECACSLHFLCRKTLRCKVY